MNTNNTRHVRNHQNADNAREIALRQMRSYAEAVGDEQLTSLVSILADLLLESAFHYGEQWDEPDGHEAGSIAAQWLYEFICQLCWDEPVPGGLGIALGRLLASHDTGQAALADIAATNSKYCLELEVADHTERIAKAERDVSISKAMRARCIAELAKVDR